MSAITWIISAGDCTTTVYDPTGCNSICTFAQEDTCKLGDLSSKLGNLTIQDTKAFFGTDKKLTLSGGESVVNKKLIIFDKDVNKTQLFCGPIKLVSEYHLKSTF